ncbi:DUF3606 domain-containing protein [Sphingobium herbicidovorans]|nr:DUF3606 domain-containing protein [Sphingobium herbicidovorans]
MNKAASNAGYELSPQLSGTSLSNSRSYSREEPSGGKRIVIMASLNFRPTDENRAPPIPRDIKHVSLTSDLEVQYWSQRLQTSRRQLEEAVDRVGHNVKAVADYLDRNR